MKYFIDHLLGEETYEYEQLEFRIIDYNAFKLSTDFRNLWTSQIGPKKLQLANRFFECEQTIEYKDKPEKKLRRVK